MDRVTRRGAALLTLASITLALVSAQCRAVNVNGIVLPPAADKAAYAALTEPFNSTQSLYDQTRQRAKGLEALAHWLDELAKDKQVQRGLADLAPALNGFIPDPAHPDTGQLVDVRVYKSPLTGQYATPKVLYIGPGATPQAAADAAEKHGGLLTEVPNEGALAPAQEASQWLWFSFEYSQDKAGHTQRKLVGSVVMPGLREAYYAAALARRETLHQVAAGVKPAVAAPKPKNAPAPPHPPVGHERGLVERIPGSHERGPVERPPTADHPTREFTGNRAPDRPVDPHEGTTVGGTLP